MFTVGVGRVFAALRGMEMKFDQNYELQPRTAPTVIKHVISNVS